MPCQPSGASGRGGPGGRSDRAGPEREQEGATIHFSCPPAARATRPSRRVNLCARSAIFSVETNLMQGPAARSTTSCPGIRPDSGELIRSVDQRCRCPAHDHGCLSRSNTGNVDPIRPVRRTLIQSGASATKRRSTPGRARPNAGRPGDSRRDQAHARRRESHPGCLRRAIAGLSTGARHSLPVLRRLYIKVYESVTFAASATSRAR